MASALAILQDRDAALRAREDFLVSSAESLPSPDAVLAALNESAKERADIGAERESLATQINAEVARRGRIATSPAIAADEIAVAAQATSAKADDAPKPFKTLGAQMLAVAEYGMGGHGRAPHPGLAALMDWEKTQAAVVGGSTVIGGDSGFLVQTDHATGLVGDVFSASVLGNLAQKREIGPGSNGATWNMIDETSRADGSRYGGVRAYWVAEGGSMTATRPKVLEQELKLAKLTGLYVATSDELADSTMLESFARPAFISEFAFKVDDAMIRGTGAGIPQGILNADCLISVAKETGQAAATVLYENVLAMSERLSPASETRAAWYINAAVLRQLRTMVQVIGTGGVPVYLPPTGAAGSPFGGTLLGLPVHRIEHASALGTVGDIMLADWNEYLLIQKGGIQEASSIHVYFDTDQQVFRWILRTNGRPIRANTVTPYKGSLTTSPFVVLASRT